MVDIEKLDNELYKSIYIKPSTKTRNEIWNRIKNNPEILKEAVQVKRDKFDERDIVKGLTICETMLMDYESVDQVAYNSLIDFIYTNTDIARIVIDGASNGGYSFLLISLWNHNLKLTKAQTAFAVDEAMNKIGTTRWHKIEEELSKKLDNIGINDEDTVFININGCINPIGQKTGLEYMNYMFSTLNQTQAHGTGEFDIRYYILRNPNWSFSEKQKLIMDFWYDAETYDNNLRQWEGEIISEIENFDLYEYTYEMLLKKFKDKKTTEIIWNEICFCKQMHQLRPQQWELESKKEKGLVKK